MPEGSKSLWQKHRTLLLPGKVDLSAKIVLPPINPKDQSPRMGVPDPSQSGRGAPRTIWGFRYLASQLTAVGLQEWDGQRFADYSTPWEKEWSVLCSRTMGRMSPVVDDSGQVMGHSGRVSGSYIGYFSSTGERVQYVLRSTHAFSTWMMTKVRGRLSQGNTDTTYNLLVGVDGEVLLKDSASTRGVEVDDIQPIDLFYGMQMLVDLGAAGVKVVVALQERRAAGKAAKMLAGPTREMIEKLVRKKGPLRFTVKEVGPDIAGTSVPEWIHIEVGDREFMIERNALAQNEAGEEIGHATKHLVDRSKGKWSNPSPYGRQSNYARRMTQTDYPMSPLAGGLDIAKGMIEEGRVPLHNGRRGVFWVDLPNDIEDGWEFIIDTNQSPWKVYHAQINSMKFKSRIPARVPGSD